MIAGRTNENQKVTATAHRALFHGTLGDGIIKGCSLNHAGSTLTIGTGFLLLSGNEIEIVAAETVEITQMSGYARVKAKIDLNQVATKTEFEQFLWEVEYAASASGFPELTQEDINGGDGTVYEMELCILTLGSSGITGIYRKTGGVKINSTTASSHVVRITASETLSLSREGKLIIAVSTEPITITVPANANVAFPAETEIEICQYSTGTVTFAAANGVTINSLDGALSISGQYGCTALKKLDTNTWLLSGALG